MGHKNSVLLDFKPLFKDKLPKTLNTLNRLQFILDALLDYNSCPHHIKDGAHLVYIRDLFHVCKWPENDVSLELNNCYNNVIVYSNSIKQHVNLELYIRQLCFLIGCEITSVFVREN